MQEEMSAIKVRLRSFLMNHPGANVPDMYEALKEEKKDSILHALYRMMEKGEVEKKGSPRFYQYYLKETFKPIEIKKQDRQKEELKKMSLEDFSTKELLDELRFRGHIIYFQEML